MLNIAIDGFSGAGKSTVADQIAEKLNIKKFDTGAMYRGLACEHLAQSLPEPNEQIIENFISSVSVESFFEGNKQHVVVNGTDYTQHLREEKIGYYSSLISPFPHLRQKVLSIQRTFASQNDCVMEGRDIGSVVLPNASVKFFLTASLEKRTQRRLKQLQEMGLDGNYEEIYASLKVRDQNDLSRKIAPLIKVDDAIEIDASEKTIDEVVDECLKIIYEKTGK